VKVLDDIPALVKAHQLNPSAMKIFRHYDAAIEDLPHYIAQSGGVLQAVARWIGEVQEAITHLPFAYFEGCNEQDPTDEMIAFETLRARMLIKLGRKPCVLNLGVGHTDDPLWQKDNMQNLIRLVETTGIVGLHGYGQGIISASCGDCYWKPNGTWNGGTPFPQTLPDFHPGRGMLWQAMRPVDDQRMINLLGLHPLIVITEAGCDDNYNGGLNGVFLPFGIRTRGWRSCGPVWKRAGWTQDRADQQFMFESLEWYCNITKFKIAVYAHGDDGTFDTRGLL
jgi:hypothetical protein